jgi:hypothetical protein
VSAPIVTDRLPCEMAQLSSVTARFITTEPVRAFMITLAAASDGLTSMFSSMPRKDTRWSLDDGTRTRITRPSSAVAMPGPNLSLIASTTRLAVAKSVVFSSSLTWLSAPRFEATARSTVAPAEMRPTASWFTCTEAPPPEAPNAADQHITLGHGIHLAVGALQRRHQQRAAAQAFRVTHRGHGDVDGLARLGEGRQRGRDHHGRHVLQLQLGAGRQADALLLQHRHDRLHGERGLGGLVAGAVEADHDAVAGQLVLAHAAEAGEVLQALGVGRGRSGSGRAGRRPGSVSV